MRIIIVFVLSACIQAATAQQAFVSPLFQRVVANDDQVYDTKDWSLFTGAPVRGTPLVVNETVYVGNAAGDFFAINSTTGKVKWKYHTGFAIHSSSITDGRRVYFADNRQTLYALDLATGKPVWKYDFGQKRPYVWRYDYYHASPVLHQGKLLVGAEDGSFYALNPASGKLLWKFQANGIIRSTAAIYKNSVLFGDTEATLYSLDIATGKELWQYRINGDTMRNEDWGFDRRAITSSPVVAGDRVIFGARDGYLYCNSASDGKSLWKVDHQVSWVISTVAVKDSFVVTGTSDGRFVQAVNLQTGVELWKFRTPLAVWASPLIVGPNVYAGTFDGQLYCIDLKTGKRVSQFKVNGKFLSSPVYAKGRVFAGCDDGNLYSFKGHAKKDIPGPGTKRYVFYEPNTNIYFRGGSDVVIRNYLRGNGYKTIGTDSLAYFMAQSSTPSVIVFATSYFPPEITTNGEQSLIRKYLDNGGRIVLSGINPILYKVDPKLRQAVAFNPGAADSVFSIDYGAGDTRTFMGDFPVFPTAAGRELGLPDFWTSSVFINPSKVDIVLGKNENGDASAYIKKYTRDGQLVQLFMDTDRPDHLDAILKAAEWKM